MEHMTENKVVAAMAAEALAARRLLDLFGKPMLGMKQTDADAYRMARARAENSRRVMDTKEVAQP